MIWTVQLATIPPTSMLCYHLAQKIVIAAVQSWKCLSFELTTVSFYAASLSAMKSNFPKTAQLDDDEWERMSSYSLAKPCNTGFSKGTADLRPDGRFLNFDIDEYLIRHGLAKCGCQGIANIGEPISSQHPSFLLGSVLSFTQSPHHP